MIPIDVEGVPLWGAVRDLIKEVKRLTEQVEDLQSDVAYLLKEVDK